MSKSTVRVKSTKRGTTIRATGSAAQAIFDALTGGECTPKKPARPSNGGSTDGE